MHESFRPQDARLQDSTIEQAYAKPSCLIAKLVLWLADQQLKPDGGVKVDEMMQTNMAGIWAIGDIRNTSFKQAVGAAGDGCIAAMDVDRYLNQRKNIKPDWS